ncbi:hypothetical protein GWK41_08995 [Persephonella atlantica]|uniref:Uncharacterized protein n=1 Tax=Persephonella atlantica TaxID=2699429 RepID=A0ABS1GJZ1_9AQUI|nr:hypothetical protein [Persephonella atlantica]MBK3333206.1 hypothetical protein [Persephonella atlantica]
MSYLEENLKVANLHLDRLKKASTEILERNLLENLDIDDFELKLLKNNDLCYINNKKKL